MIIFLLSFFFAPTFNFCEAHHFSLCRIPFIVCWYLFCFVQVSYTINHCPINLVDSSYRFNRNRLDYSHPIHLPSHALAIDSSESVSVITGFGGCADGLFAKNYIFIIIHLIVRAIVCLPIMRRISLHCMILVSLPISGYIREISHANQPKFRIFSPFLFKYSRVFFPFYAIRRIANLMHCTLMIIIGSCQ